MRSFIDQHLVYLPMDRTQKAVLSGAVYGGLILKPRETFTILLVLQNGFLSTQTTNVFDVAMGHVAIIA